MADEEQVVEDGHEVIYRLTAINRKGRVETKYFKSPYETKGWRDRLRNIDCRTQVGGAPASAFEPVDDADLDRLAREEVEALKES